MLVTHCFSVYCNEFIPVQLFMSLSSVYPERQEQLYPPIELVHMCSQSSVLRAHSSISEITVYTYVVKCNQILSMKNINKQ